LKKEVDLYKEKCYALLSPYSIPKGSITKVVAEDALKAKGVPGDIIAQYGLICRLRLDVQKRFDEKEKELADLESKLETHEATFVEVQEKVFDMGPIEKAVETQFLPSINVSRDVYFGGKFVGVMIKRLMKKENREALWTFLRAQYAKHGIQGAEVLIAKVKPLFDAFADLMHLARACRVLKDEEVEQLCKSCAPPCRGSSARSSPTARSRRTCSSLKSPPLFDAGAPSDSSARILSRVSTVS
jgi:hypothetical protein